MKQVLHLKKSNEFEKKFKIAKKMAIIAFWTQKIIKFVFYGFVAFCLILFTTKNMSLSVFLGSFIAYMFIGFKISDHANPVFGFDFCVYNCKFALIMIIVAILALAASSPIVIITWPLLITGFVLLISALMGAIGIALTNYYTNYDYE